MLKIIIAGIVVAIYVVMYSLLRTAGLADSRLEEIQRRSLNKD